jgi:hypothetical protein
MIAIQYPNMREELVGYLRSLSDIEYQKRIWVEGLSEEGVQHDELDYAIHYLYDDTNLAENPESTVGVILRNNLEASRIASLISSIDVIFEKYGKCLADAEYMALPEWQAVIAAAQNALDLIVSND